MGKALKGEQLTLDQIPVRTCCSCGTYAHHKNPAAYQLPPQPIICSISTQIYRSVDNGQPSRIQAAGRSILICDKCLQAALVTPLLFESPEGLKLLRALREALIPRYKAILEEQGE